MLALINVHGGIVVVVVDDEDVVLVDVLVLLVEMLVDVLVLLVVGIVVVVDVLVLLVVGGDSKVNEPATGDSSVITVSTIALLSVPIPPTFGGWDHKPADHA